MRAVSIARRAHSTLTYELPNSVKRGARAIARENEKGKESERGSAEGQQSGTLNGLEERGKESERCVCVCVCVCV